MWSIQSELTSIQAWLQLQSLYLLVQSLLWFSLSRELFKISKNLRTKTYTLYSTNENKDNLPRKQYLALLLYIVYTLSQRQSIFRDITWNVAGKTWYTTRNISCSIMFSSTFHVISRKFGLLFGQCIPRSNYRKHKRSLGTF